MTVYTRFEICNWFASSMREQNYQVKKRAAIEQIDFDSKPGNKCDD